jgi:hypothetical protein
MNNVFTLRQVSSKQDIREFHKITDRLYKDEKNWIKPIYNDIESVFTPASNPLFRTGEAIRWLLLDHEGKAVGRVAAFYNKKISASHSIPVGSMGFFECINNREAAFTLFNACTDWLKSKNMQAMEGPVNFGERDRWWGLLVDGFTQPNYCMPYNFKYYRDLFEEYGFKNYFEQYTYAMPVSGEGLSNVIKEKAKRVFANPDYSFRYMKLREKNQIARNFMIIYNKGWARFPGVKTISIAYARKLFKSLRPVIDEKLLWFGFYKDEPVCFFLMLPEVNQITKHLNGKMNFIGKAKFLYYRRIARKLSKAYGLIFGIVPDHQRKGVEGALIMSFARLALSKHFTYKELEFNWIGDFNPSMMHLLDEIGAKICKTHITYRYLFDRSAVFERAPIVNAG